MKTTQLLNYERDRWIAGDGGLAEIQSAIDGSPVALTGSNGLDFGAMLRHAREVGGSALRRLTFHERARMIKALGLAIMARKEELYELNYLTGAGRARTGGSTSRAARARSSHFRRRGAGSFRMRTCCSTASLRGCRSKGRSSASISTRRCRARRCTSTPSTSRSGECSKSSPDDPRRRSSHREARVGDGLPPRPRSR